tara:strand:+ start:245 stop:1180 length:936 start_codon:yes stop_codon:yes gene_type:complete
MKATREALKDLLPEMGNKHKNIVVLDADIGSATRLASFKTTHPDRFFQVGIAEANMIGISSGLSEHGFKVFMGSFSSFLTGRYDIIRCSLAYSKSPVVLIGSHVGMAIGKDGVTQMGLEDVGVMRSLPNMTILNPSTYTEAVEIVKFLCNNELDGPHYLRVGRQSVEDCLAEKEYKFHFGKGFTVEEGDDITLFSTGCVLPDVTKAKTKIESQTGLTVRVINFHTLKPIDKEIIAKASQETKYLFSVEDHSVVGGLGSIISEVLCESNPARLTKIGLQDEFPESGPPNDLYNKYGLTSDKIASKVVDYVNR